MTSPKRTHIAHGLSDYFLHQEIRDNGKLIFRARILALTLLSIISVTFGMGVIAAIYPPLASVRDVTLVANAISIVTLSLALYRLKSKGDYGLCCFITVALSFLSVALAGIATGGPSFSPTFQLMVIPCTVAYFFGGLRWGVAVSVTSFFLIVTFLAFELSGFQFPRLIVEPQASKFVVIINIITVALLALMYETMSNALKGSRDRQLKEYEKLAITDSLTGLPNRRIFNEVLSARIALYSTMTPMKRFTLCYLDLDKFKPVNDQLGHGVGDEVLREISCKLRLALRGADFISRIGGDEFMMLLGETYEIDAVQASAERYLKLIREPIKTSAGIVELDGSLGFAIYPDHGANMLTLEKSADAAMYEAKKARCGYQIFATKHRLADGYSQP